MLDFIVRHLHTSFQVNEAQDISLLGVRKVGVRVWGDVVSIFSARIRKDETPMAPQNILLKYQRLVSETSRENGRRCFVLVSLLALFLYFETQ
jgi:hypothetical protein